MPNTVPSVVFVAHARGKRNHRRTQAANPLTLTPVTDSSTYEGRNSDRLMIIGVGVVVR